ncbi:MAG: TIGR02757 family protein [Saprospiraceae bacterium]|nr:TIGR02757 family protein [Saprospiraceae bacterium]
MLHKSGDDLKFYLEDIVDKVNRIDFIELDPISIPHSFNLPQDIEISGFFSAMLAWGNRKTIIRKSKELMVLMDNAPYDFIRNHSEKDKKVLLDFKHRTFQATDLLYFIDFLQRHFTVEDSLEKVFRPDCDTPYSQEKALIGFNHYFFNADYSPQRTRKHIATPDNKSTCKRLNMYLRWMVRSDDRKVDFGLWKTIPMSGLMMPLDVHVEHYARKFNLITRKQRDWQTVKELTESLRHFDPHDPVRYDFALFGLGVMK